MKKKLSTLPALLLFSLALLPSAAFAQSAASPAYGTAVVTNPNAQVLGRYSNGDIVTMLGIVDDWYHVKAGDLYGFMSRDYLSMIPSDKAPSAANRFAVSTHLQDYTINANLDEGPNGVYSIRIALTFDPGYTTNDDIASYNLYINGSFAVNVPAYWDEGNDILAATTFFTTIAYPETINSVYLKPVREEAGECEEIIALEK